VKIQGLENCKSKLVNGFGQAGGENEKPLTLPSLDIAVCWSLFLFQRQHNGARQA
jgi:hypothetical protein